MLAHIQIAYK